VAERHRDVRGAQAGQAVASCLASGDGGEALLDVAPVGVNLQGRQGLDGGSLGGIQVPQRDQMVSQGSRLVAGPGVERRDKLRLLDQAGLEGEQAEEEMAVGGHGLLRWMSFAGRRLPPSGVARSLSGSATSL
jgi:hypothetical protein